MLLPTRRIYLNAFKCIMYFVCYVMHDKKIVKQDWIYPIPSQNNIGPLNRFELTLCVALYMKKIVKRIHLYQIN